jgi:hypothetical protein
MAAVLNALDLARVGETRIVVGHALRSGCHDRCEYGIFRVRLTREQPDANWPVSAASMAVPHGRLLPLLVSSTATLRSSKGLLWALPAAPRKNSNARRRGRGSVPVITVHSPCATHWPTLHLFQRWSANAPGLTLLRPASASLTCRQALALPTSCLWSPFSSHLPHVADLLHASPAALSATRVARLNHPAKPK